jgi:hypothetical protein
MVAELHVTLRLEHGVELVKGHLVPELIFLVLIAVFLDGVVGEVDVDILDVLRIVLLTGRADVTLTEKVQLHCMRHQGPHTNVELPVVYQQRSLDVFLQHKRRRLYPHEVRSRVRLPCLLLQRLRVMFLR